MKPFSTFCIAPFSFPFPSSVSLFHLAEPWHHACLLPAGRMDLLLPPTLPFSICNTKLNTHPRTGCNSCNIGHFHFCNIMYSVKTSGGTTFLWIINMCTYVPLFSLVSAYVQAKNKRSATFKGCIYISCLCVFWILRLTCIQVVMDQNGVITEFSVSLRKKKMVEELWIPLFLRLCDVNIKNSAISPFLFIYLTAYNSNLSPFFTIFKPTNNKDIWPNIITNKQALDKCQKKYISW